MQQAAQGKSTADGQRKFPAPHLDTRRRWISLYKTDGEAEAAPAGEQPAKE
jgi:hypothetical protein